MSDSIAMWLSGQWLEIASLLIASAALYYARQAHHSSVSTAAQQRAAELTALRIQAKSGLNEVHHSLIALRRDCQANRAEWKLHEHRNGPVLGQMKPMFHLSPSDKVQHRGTKVFESLGQRYSGLDTMKTGELEMLVNEARKASLQIMALAGELEGPPNYSR